MHLIEQKLRDYHPESALEQDIALTEIVQQFILFGLARSGFFSDAAFHGGTCLRILFGLPRFSEDLDFVLKAPDRGFSWARHLQVIRDECAAYGVELEAKDRARETGAVQAAFLKTDSLGTILRASLPFSAHPRRKIAVKVEIDTNPPAGGDFESRYLTFPGPAAVTTLDEPSGFAGKLHALLCRAYVKGRDWYDLHWYADRRVKPNLPLLAAALNQTGPWKGQRLKIDTAWVLDELARKIQSIDWVTTRDDVARFIPAREQKSLETWSTGFFLDVVSRMHTSWR
ncbi:MAG TPA: nucleotidyl transferase AbiEii/AbiGii toxin family protein [Candidatus Ozemobacteraceae bacterium]|nr:nucleotidyl transferase AbiEii/AbiGii toxin family protein [Candidatus Ozemobacteraceae bacterium]